MSGYCNECGETICVCSEIASEPVTKTNKDLYWELRGVIIDVEQGGGFDDVCLETIKRVADSLAKANADAYYRGYQQGKFDAQADAAQSDGCSTCGIKGIHACLGKKHDLEPKPQGWMLITEPGVCHGLFRFKVDAEEAAHEAAMRFSIVPLYTAPPQRQWRGLTDEEVIDAANAAPFATMVTADDFIFVLGRAIEAKLREKNG